MRKRTFEDVVERLLPDAQASLREATNSAKKRGEAFVDLQHWLIAMLDDPGSELQSILRAFSIDPARVEQELEDALERFRTPGSSKLDFCASNNLQLAIEQAMLQSVCHGDGQSVRMGHVVLGLFDHADLKRCLRDLTPTMARIDPGRLADRFADIVDGAGDDMVPESNEPGPSKASTALQRYTVDLTAEAEGGAIDPVIGRDEEIRQAIDILMRRRQNNPILVGEAGVGKTAVVEGMALRIAKGDVPPMMEGVRLLGLDLGLLQAGAGVKGEFEKRLKAVIDDVQASPSPVILFIDEAHTLIGAGGTAGTGDAANLLKPELARGRLRTIAATTWSEYKKHIENDPALTRRFQTVAVDEPDEDRAVTMLRGTTATLEQHHGVIVLDEAIEAAVRLSKRYIHGRQLPDKAVSVLDTACSRVAGSLQSMPAPLDDIRRRIEALETELLIIEREARFASMSRTGGFWPTIAWRRRKPAKAILRAGSTRKRRWSSVF